MSLKDMDVVSKTASNSWEQTAGLGKDNLEGVFKDKINFNLKMGICSSYIFIEKLGNKTLSTVLYTLTYTNIDMHTKIIKKD